MSKLLEQINKELETKEIISLSSLMSQITSKINKIQKSDYLKSGLVPIYDQGDNGVSGYSNNTKDSYNGKFPVVIFGDHTLKLRKISSPFYLGADGNQLIEPVDENILDRNYFYYLLLSKKPRSYGYERHFKYLKEVKVNLPSFPTQKKIASILGAYDEKIDNNNKVIKNLEETAQIIFNEWFVNFKFPGYEKVKMVDSEIGEIPEGWEIGNIETICKRLSSGKVFKEDEILINGNVPVYDQSSKGIIGYHNEEPEFNASLEKPILIFGDHTCRSQIVCEPFSLGPNTIPLEEKDNYNPIFSYFLTKGLIEQREYKRHWNELVSNNFIIPDVNLVNKFIKLVNPVMAKILFNEKENISLKSQRDLLLAKLI